MLQHITLSLIMILSKTTYKIHPGFFSGITACTLLTLSWNGLRMCGKSGDTGCIFTPRLLIKRLDSTIFYDVLVCSVCYYGQPNTTLKFKNRLSFLCC